MIRSTRYDVGTSPVLSIALLLVVTVGITALAANFVFDTKPTSMKDKFTGVDVQFEEPKPGLVRVELVDGGTADAIYVNTSRTSRRLTQNGDSVYIPSGEGRISVIAESNDVYSTIQTYVPNNAPSQLLVADAGPKQSQAPGTSYTFNGSTSIGNISEYRWDFDADGATDATGEVVSHTFSNPGVYTVSLTVVGSKGGTHTNQTTVRNAHAVVDKYDTDTGTYSTIQNAINAASDGWSIYVAPDQYEESVVVNVTNITLFSNKEPTVSGEDLTDGNPGFKVTASGTTIKNIRVEDYAGREGILVDAADTELSQVTVVRSGDSIKTGAVTLTTNSGGAIIKQSLIASSRGCGLTIGDNSDVLGGPTNIRVDQTDIRSGTNYGICSLATSSDTTVTKTQVENNDHGGVLLYGTETFTFKHSTLMQNGKKQPDEIGGFHAYKTKDVHIEGTEITDNFEHGISLNDVKNVKVRDTSVSYNSEKGIYTRGPDATNQLGDSMTTLAILLDGVSLLTSHDSIYNNNSHEGLFINASDDMRFENSTFLYNGNGTTTTQGVYVSNLATDEASNITLVFGKMYGSGSEDIFVESQTEDVNATRNWWGQDTGPKSSQYGGSVDVSNHCTVENCSDQK